MTIQNFLIFVIVIISTFASKVFVLEILSFPSNFGFFRTLKNPTFWLFLEKEAFQCFQISKLLSKQGFRDFSLSLNKEKLFQIEKFSQIDTGNLPCSIKKCNLRCGNPKGVFGSYRSRSQKKPVCFKSLHF